MPKIQQQLPLDLFVQKRKLAQAVSMADLVGDQGYDVEGNFWTKVKRGEPNECWEWTGAVYEWGYGVMKVANRRNCSAHRVSYVIHHGPIPDGMFVCHSCDNPPCVNPSHIFLGTPADNLKDAASKNRMLFGEAHPGNKFSAESVAKVRAGYPRLSERELANLYGVSEGMVYRIVRGLAWKKS